MVDFQHPESLLNLRHQSVVKKLRNLGVIKFKQHGCNLAGLLGLEFSNLREKPLTKISLCSCSVVMVVSRVVS